MMTNVVPIFGDKPPPETPPESPPKPDPEWMQRFIEDDLSHAAYLFQKLQETEDETEFREAAHDFQRAVAAWQV